MRLSNQKTRLGGPYNKNGGREDPKNGFKWNLPQHNTSGKTKNQMGRRGSEGCITAVRSKRMEEKSWKQERVEARFEGGQGPEGAVVPYMEKWNALVNELGSLRCHQYRKTYRSFGLLSEATWRTSTGIWVSDAPWVMIHVILFFHFGWGTLFSTGRHAYGSRIQFWIPFQSNY